MHQGRPLQFAIWVNVVAIATSAVHAAGDAVLILAIAPIFSLVYSLVAVLAYWIWIRSLRELARRGYGGTAAVAMALLWAALLNGGTIAFCPLQFCWPWASLYHVVVIIAGIGAAAITLPVLRRPYAASN